jgi:4-hydroxy-tetrahydrodipicolinate synthase
VNRAPLNRAELSRRLATVVGIPVVPYTPDGRIDHELAGTLTRRLGEHGVQVLTPNGNTGEFYALAPEERRAILRTVIANASAGTTIVAGVGFDLATAIADARFAAEAGADAIMIHQPVLPYLSPDGWVAYNRAIAEAVPELGVVPYLSTPTVSGRHIGTLVEQAPNVVAVKYSVPDPVVFATTRAQADTDIVWIAGLAESYAPAYWQGGARGFTSGLVNVAPSVSLGMLDALQAGDYERAGAIWRDISAFEELRARNRSADNVSVVKEAMHQLGLADRSVRPPSAPLDEAGRAAVGRSIAGWPIAPLVRTEAGALTR